MKLSTDKDLEGERLLNIVQNTRYRIFNWKFRRLTRD